MLKMYMCLQHLDGALRDNKTKLLAIDSHPSGKFSHLMFTVLITCLIIFNRWSFMGLYVHLYFTGSFHRRKLAVVDYIASTCTEYQLFSMLFFVFHYFSLFFF